MVFILWNGKVTSKLIRLEWKVGMVKGKKGVHGWEMEGERKGKGMWDGTGGQGDTVPYVHPIPVLGIACYCYYSITEMTLAE